ncbi:recombinase-like helix-turn-helix domain-containing protein [Actinomadura sp. 21ATH]|uniref:recombinase-like helix-turn-helix domain-containing protein n=1 Tax=Actinomadura sp. 21ATH TaxID=1735444 RepID=UPI0035C0E728
MALRLRPVQSRDHEPTSYENALADELEAIFGTGVHDLPGLVAALNETGLRPADGADWTAESFAAEMARLGEKEHAPFPADPAGPAGERAARKGGGRHPSGNAALDTADGLVRLGLRDRWYALCRSEEVRRGQLTRLERAGEELLLWRDAAGTVHVQEDRCPHRGARLSRGVHMGDRIACEYHGVQVDAEGVVVSVPGSPGCALEGKRSLRTFPAVEHADAVFAWFGDPEGGEPAPFVLPEGIGGEWEHFLAYVEWDAPWVYSLDNLMDPMHGAFLHRKSHTMAGGKREAVFQIRDTDTGFVFEKTDQAGVNFDWSEWIDTAMQWVRLEIPYPATAGPGGPFRIVCTATPINENQHAAFFWRCRKVGGWERDVWRFLYKTRLEERHWAVLEQDRRMEEAMPLDAWDRENLYQHDLALVRLRRLLRNEARKQIRAREERAAAPAPAAPAAPAGTAVRA